MEDADPEQLQLFGPPSAVERPRCAYDRPLSLLHTKASTPPGLYLGTSSWSFPGWQDLVYESQHTESELSKWGLRAYSQVPYFRTVSLDRTYYRPMKMPQYRHLYEQVGNDFRFLVKAPRDLIQAKSMEATRFQELFLDPLGEGLGEKLGAVVFQFPPGSRAEHGGERAFLHHLERVLKACPRELPKCLELRDVTMLGPALKELLGEHHSSWCGSVHPELPSVDQQWLTLPPAPRTPLVIRWNLRPSLTYQQARAKFAPFCQLSSPDEPRRVRLVSIIHRALKAGRTVFVTVNNKAEGCSPLSVKALLEEYSSRYS